MSVDSRITAILFAVEKKDNHSNNVAKLVGEYTDKEEIIAAAILHDILKETDTQVEELYPLFGHPVTEMIELLTNNETEITQMGYGDYICTHIVNLPSDVLLIKLAQLYFTETDPINAIFIISTVMQHCKLNDSHQSILKKWNDKLNLLLI